VRLRARAEGASWRPAGATVFWLQEALRALDGDLRARFGPGAGIAFRRGPYLAALQGAAAELGAGAVFMGRRCNASVNVLCGACLCQLSCCGVFVVKWLEAKFGGFYGRKCAADVHADGAQHMTRQTDTEWPLSGAHARMIASFRPQGPWAPARKSKFLWSAANKRLGLLLHMFSHDVFK